MFCHPLCSAANQQCQRHVGSCQAGDRTPGVRVGPGDGHNELPYELPGQLCTETHRLCGSLHLLKMTLWEGLGGPPFYPFHSLRSLGLRGGSSASRDNDVKDNKGRKESWRRWVSGLSMGRGWQVRDAGKSQPKASGLRIFLQNAPEQGVLSSIHLRPYHSAWLTLGPRDHVQVSATSFGVTTQPYLKLCIWTSPTVFKSPK